MGDQREISTGKIMKTIKMAVLIAAFFDWKNYA